MRKSIFKTIFLSVAMLPVSLIAAIQLQSPDKKQLIQVSTNENASLVYTVKYKGKTVVQPSQLGLITNIADFSKNIKIHSISKAETITESYWAPAEKRQQRTYKAQKMAIDVEAENGKIMTVELRATNDGVAYRYIVNNDIPVTVMSEQSAFCFDLSTKAWLHPHAEVKTGWCETQPSYEEQYEYDIPVGTASTLKQGWSFPALFSTKEAWVLLSEAGLTPDYVGTHLAHESTGGRYTIAFPQFGETLTAGESIEPVSKHIVTPWRTIVVGTLSGVVESQMVSDLAQAADKSTDFSWVKTGIASWSWGVLHDESVNYETSREFITYAGKMGWEYCLIDADWDRKIGYNRIKELADYAKTLNVILILWYNSSGPWNSTRYSPKNALLTDEKCRAEFTRIRQMGIAGVKVDFWPGDGQSAIKYYWDMLQAAADNHLVINFHGTTVPRGWSRTFPNLVTMEAIRGFEFTTFDQKDTDAAPRHLTMIPFARNVVGPMDFTPVCFGEIEGKKRRTSNAMELALTVVLQSGLQHFVEIPQSMEKQPDYVQKYMKQLPRIWDDVKLLDGCPGKYVVIARKSAGKWYVGAINSQSQAQKVRINLKSLGLKKATLITDGENNRSFVQKSVDKNVVEVDIQAGGGCVIF